MKFFARRSEPHRSTSERNPHPLVALQRDQRGSGMLEKLAVVSAIVLPLIAVLYMALRDNIRPQLEDRSPPMDQISNQTVIDVLF